MNIMLASQLAQHLLSANITTFYIFISVGYEYTRANEKIGTWNNEEGIFAVFYRHVLWMLVCVLCRYKQSPSKR